MDRITLIKTTDDTIWVTSDENQIGIENEFKECKNVEQWMLIALADFLGYDPETVLCFDE